MKINGVEIVQRDTVGEAPRKARRNAGESCRRIVAHCNAFLVRRGLPLSDCDFRTQTAQEAKLYNQRKAAA